ncbi:MAG: helix-turn-helix transcriptional regulator [Planctomycetota bacterium]
MDVWFHDSEQLAEAARAWNLDFRQVERGTFAGHLLQIVGPDVSLAYARFTRSLDQRGAPPPGLRTFVVPAHREVTFHWRGHTIRGDQLLIFPRDGELESFSGPDFEVHTISVSEAGLERAAERLGVASVEPRLRSREVLDLPAAVADRMRLAVQRHYSGWSPDSAAGLSEMLVACVQSTEAGRAGDARGRLLSRARAELRLGASRPWSVAEWAERIDVHERTLQRAFRDLGPVSPKTYLLALRLNEVRRQLRARPDLGVGEAARSHGFWHMGQFAAE